MSSSTLSSTSSSGSSLRHPKREDDIAISVKDLAKSYTILHEERQTTLIHTAMARAKNPLQRPQKETFWALNGVTFDIKRGEVVGIIGRNGAGKSTLLKVLSRITEPTRGRAVMHGRVGSLLEVGTGFHPELTGRENVYLNGAILGMSRREIDRQFDAIVDFSGTEKFLDTPVKRYSSGMYVRLAFAVAAHLNPEILIVDEVLAVGDAEFQKKCLGKMDDVAQSGRTVLVVSHNMATMNALCTSCIYMESGSVRAEGPTADVISKYLKDLVENKSLDLNSLRHSNMGKEIRFTDIDLISEEEGFVPLYSPITFTLTIESDIDQKDLSIGGSIFSDNGSCVGTLFSKQHFNLKKNQNKTVELIVSKSQLAPGSYFAGFSVGTGGNGSTRKDFDIVIGKPAFEILSHSQGAEFIAEWHSNWGNIVFNNIELVETMK